MGQYHKIVNLDKKQELENSGHGWKLLEFSWQRCILPKELEYLLENDWAGDNVVVAGDYATVNGVSDKRDAEILEKIAKEYDIEDGDIYRYSEDHYEVISKEQETANYNSKRYIYNTITNEYIDKQDCDISVYGRDRIAPLPLLLDLGNGLGGGDYYGANHKYVGYWAGKSQGIKFSDKVPEGYKYLKIDFNEN